MAWTERDVDENLESVHLAFVPDFEHRKYLESVYRYDLFLKSTSSRVGGQPVLSAIRFSSELDEERLKIDTGVYVWETDWRHFVKPEHISGSVGELRRLADTFVKGGVFDNWAANMQREYEHGLEFIGLFIDAFTARFPNFSNVINQYANYKRLLFLNAGNTWATHVHIDRNEFSISLGEVERTSRKNELPWHVIEKGGKEYFLHIGSGLWYPTKERVAYHPEDDLAAKEARMLESFEVIEDRLKVIE